MEENRKRRMEVNKMIDSVRSRWLLRLSSIGFIMLVNKQTGEYRNLYLKDFKNKRALEYIANVLDKHPSIEE